MAVCARVCVRSYVCEHVFVDSIGARIAASQLHLELVFMCVCVYAMCIYICVFLYGLVCMFVCVCVHEFLSPSVRAPRCVRMCVCVFSQIHVHVNTHSSTAAS